MVATSVHEVVIVGAGPAGIGVAAALRDAGVNDVAIIDRYGIGASFRRWPVETRLLTPSFPSTGWGQADLNAVIPHSSPGWSLRTEHPTGSEYADYLAKAAEVLELKVGVGANVMRIELVRGRYRLVLSDASVMNARCVVWAAGEFQYPRQQSFPGSELCLHSGSVRSYAQLPDTQHVVIGGGESGVDAAINLAMSGREVVLITEAAGWEVVGDSDPSMNLAPVTMDRLRNAAATGRIEPMTGAQVREVRRDTEGFKILLTDGRERSSQSPPIDASGFTGSVSVIADRFAKHARGWPLLTSEDESTKSPGLFLVGPQVRHDERIFCFIYKYRARFPVVASAIAERLGISVNGALDIWRQQGMWLDDLSCCGSECAC